MLAQHAVVARRLLAGFLKRDPGILSRPFPTHMFAFGQILLLESADDDDFHSIDFHQIYLDGTSTSRPLQVLRKYASQTRRQLPQITIYKPCTFSQKLKPAYWSSFLPRTRALTK